MIKSNISLPPAKELERDAAKWLARIDRHDDSNAMDISLDDYAAQDPEFSAWLNASPGHRVALLRLMAVWKRTHRLSALNSPGRAMPGRHRWSARRFTAIAASILLAVAVTIFLTQNPADDTYETAQGTQQSVSLQDGSQIKLNSATKLVADISDMQRVVRLEQGEVFFDIARDEKRPFKIIAGDRIVTVLGTKFSVHRRGDEIEVAVIEGRVRINSAGEEKTVIAGDIAQTAQDDIVMVSQDMARVVRELSWRKGLVIFDRATLEEAAGEFNRYNNTKFIIEDAEVSSIRVSGSFKTNNLEGFIRLLREGFGVHITRSKDKIRLFKVKNSTEI